MEQGKLYEFRERINEYYLSLKLKNQERYLRHQPDLEVEKIGDLNLDFLEELKGLEPFGAGNEEPIFCLKDVQIHDIRRMGTENQHLRIDVKGKDDKIIKLLAFFAPEEWLDLSYGDEIEPVVQLIENEFNGVRSVEGRILEL